MPTPTEAATPIVAKQAERRERSRTEPGLRRYDQETGSWVAPKVETVEEVADRIASERNRAKAFRSTPRGRLLTCIDELESVGAYAEEAYYLRGYFNRSLQDTRQPLNTAAVGECLRILNGIVGEDARAGREALADLLIEGAQVRRAA